MADQGSITALLHKVEAGDESARNRLMDQVHGDLVRLADIHMKRRFGQCLAGVTLEPGALVNETYLRLIKQRQRFDNRGHFFAIATRLMLRVLVDYQRERLAEKRFGGKARVTLSGLERNDELPATADASDLALAMEKLEALDGRSADVVKLRVLWGLSLDEIATALETSRSTVDREWRFARRWLATELAG